MNTWLTCHTHLTCTQKPWYIQFSSFCPFVPIEVFKSLPVLTIYNFLWRLHLWCLCQGSRRVQKSPQYGQEKLGSGCCWSTAGWPCCPLPCRMALLSTSHCRIDLLLAHCTVPLLLAHCRMDLLWAHFRIDLLPNTFSIARRSCSLRDRNFESTSNFKTQRNKKCDQICEA